jgi:hypothetical protein
MNGLPIKTNINNNAISVKGGMPLKHANADGTASFTNDRLNGTAIVNTPKKKFFGASNKDASSVVAKRTAITTAKQMTTPMQTNAPLASVNRYDVFNALSRTRNKGSTVPAKFQRDRREYPSAPTITSGETDLTRLIVYFEEGVKNTFPIVNYVYSLNGSKYIECDPAITSSPMYISSGLANGTTYTIKIAAKSYYGVGEFSNEITLTTFDVPAAPSNLSVVSGNGSLTVSFIPGADGNTSILDYKYSLNNGAWTSANTATSPITISGLTNNTAYGVRIRAVNAIGDGAISTNVSGTPYSMDTPVIRNALSDDQQVHIYFTKSLLPVATDYEYTLDNGANWISAVTALQPIAITGLTNGQTYNVKIRANISGAYSDSSNEVSATPNTGILRTASLYYDAVDCSLGTITAVTNSGNYRPMNGTVIGSMYVTTTPNSRKMFEFSGANYFSFGRYDFGNAFTISTWVYASNVSNINGIVANAGSNQAPIGFKVGWNNWQANNRTMYSEYGNGTEGNADATVNNVVTENAWHYLTYVIDKINQTVLYMKNGTPVKIANSSDGLIPANIGVDNANFNIGAFIGGSYALYGNMAYIKIYNTALSAADVLMDFNLEKATFGL